MRAWFQFLFDIVNQSPNLGMCLNVRPKTKSHAAAVALCRWSCRIGWPKRKIEPAAKPGRTRKHCRHVPCTGLGVCSRIRSRVSELLRFCSATVGRMPLLVVHSFAIAQVVQRERDAALADARELRRSLAEHEAERAAAAAERERERSSMCVLRTLTDFRSNQVQKLGTDGTFTYCPIRDNNNDHGIAAT